MTWAMIIALAAIFAPQLLMGVVACGFYLSIAALAIGVVVIAALLVINNASGIIISLFLIAIPVSIAFAYIAIEKRVIKYRAKKS